MTPSLLARILRQRFRLRRHDRSTRQELLQHQARELAALRRFAAERSPLYARLHQGLESKPLQELPVVTKAQLMNELESAVTNPAIRRDALLQHISSMTHQERYLGRYWTAATAGSTGLRGTFLWDDREWATVIASYSRAQDWAGVPTRLTRRQRMAVVSSKTPWHQSALVGASVNSRFLPTLRLDATATIDSIVAELNAFRPDVLVAYATMARALAEQQIAGRLSIAPRAVFCASEVLSPESRGRIQAAFGEAPYDVYAATETAGIASPCAAGRMHVYEDLVIVESVDDHDAPVPLGEAGARVLVTVLFARTLPLIRYAMSDCIKLSTEQCDCGKPYALLESIEGRSEDILLLRGSSGTTIEVHPNVFHEALGLLPAAAWQVEQTTHGVRVLVAGANRMSPESVRVDLESRLGELGAACTVEVEHVTAIERSALGKSKLVIALPK